VKKKVTLNRLRQILCTSKKKKKCTCRLLFAAQTGSGEIGKKNILMIEMGVFKTQLPETMP